MSGVTKQSFDEPDERRTPANLTVDFVLLGDTKAARMTMAPGWRWSESVKPIAQTDSCQVRHVGAGVQGVMHVVHDDGTEVDITAGDAYVIEPGHNAWVVGDETFVGFEFESKAAAEYAKG